MVRIFLLLLSSFGLLAKDKPQHRMALKDNLIAYWNMEQNPALFKVWDQSGNGNHLKGNNPLSSEGGVASGTLVPGIIGNGILLDDPSEYLEGGATSVHHTGTDYSVVIRFKAASLGNNVGILGSQNWSLRLLDSGSNSYVNLRIAGGNLLHTDVPIIVNEWYMAAFGWHDHPTFGQFSWLTVNLSDRQRLARTAWTDNPSSFAIGAISGGFPFVGVVDEAGIWRRRLDDSEIRALYNKGDGLPFEDYDTVTPCREITCCD